MATLHLTQNFQQMMKENNIWISLKENTSQNTIWKIFVVQAGALWQWTWLFLTMTSQRQWHCTKIQWAPINDMPQFVFYSPQVSVLFCPNDAWRWIATCLTAQNNTWSLRNIKLEITMELLFDISVLVLLVINVSSISKVLFLLQFLQTSSYIYLQWRVTSNNFYSLNFKDEKENCSTIEKFIFWSCFQDVDSGTMN